MNASRIHIQEEREAWGDWIAEQGPWHIFGGLTYRQQLQEQRGGVPPLSPVRDTALRHARAWLFRSDRALAGRLEAGVLALEYQQNGWPHFHPLLRLAGGLHGDEFARLGQDWFKRHGYARLEQPRDQDDVAAYASKYLVKDLSRGDVMLWPLRGSWPAHQDSLDFGDPVIDARARAGR